MTQKQPNPGSTRRDARTKRAQQEQSPRFEVRRKADGSTPPGRAPERREERERERRQRRLRNTLLIVGTLIVVGVALFALRSAPADAPIPAAARSRYDGITQSLTTTGLPRLGEPNARLQVTYYGAYDALASKTRYEELLPGLIERVRDNRINLTYVSLPGPNEVTNGLGATRAANCVLEQNQQHPGAFWIFTEALYNWQGEFAARDAFSGNRIVSGVNELGLNRADYDGCVLTGRPDAGIESAREAVRGLLNYSTPPNLAINGVVPLDDAGLPLVSAEDVLAAIDARASELTRDSSPEATPEATGEATPAAEATEPVVMEMTAEATPVLSSELTEAAPVVQATEVPAARSSQVTPASTLEATAEATLVP